MIYHLINSAVFVSIPRYLEKDIEQKSLDDKVRKRLNVSRLGGAELKRILARTMLALLTLLDFPSIVYCDDSEENLLVSLKLF